MFWGKGGIVFENCFSYVKKLEGIGDGVWEYELR